MKRIIRLTESDLARIVKRVINEGQSATIPNTALFSSPLRGEDTPWLSLTAMVGGKANALAGNKDVVEFDAKISYSKTYGGTDKQNANKVMNVKAYFGCKTNLFTAKNPSDGTIQKFGRENGDNLSYGSFVDWALTSGLCPKGSYTSQSDLRNAYRTN
jgi:hypothetical protein